IGIIDKYYDINAFHGLHGRVITYASGIKLANPDLTVIAIMGDGGAGIGGAHLLSAARRNLGITLIVANNFNYGMTGGQHSCTTPLEAVTATTPHGNLEAPLDLVRTLQPSKPSFLGRTHVFAEGQVDVLVEAIRTPGFALVDIWDSCIAYVGGRMALNKQAIESLMEKLDMPAGILYRGDRPEYSEAWRALYEEAGRRTAPQELQVVGGSALDHKVGIILAGGAGQKIRSAATLIGTAAIMSGLKATQKDDYPITVRTGHSVSEVIVSPNDIHYSGIEDPDIVIVLAKDGLAQVARKLRKCSPAARVYVDEALAGSVETPGQVIALPLAQTAKRVGKLAIAPIAFGAVLAREGLFPANILEAAARATQKEAVAESNIAGLQAGLEL
ncbi:MAG: hypothetical protein GX605_14505, partial [Chloroflexi bacterium]|nr:hypothetical protein [Chloroflexota bacterium]